VAETVCVLTGKISGFDRREVATSLIQFLESPSIEDEKREALIAARGLFRDHPLDYDPIRPDDPRTVHLVLVGLGQMGKSLALQAARTGCFANEKRIRITAIDRAAVLRERQFLDEYPAMSSLAKLEFVKGDAEDPAVLNRIREWADDREALTTVAVCIDDDSQALSCALDVLSRLETSRTQLLVRMSEDAGLATLLEGEHGNRGWPSQVHAFGMVRAACTCEAVLHEELDELARLIHSHYVATASAADRATNDPKYRSWERLDEAYRNSSRASADHIPVKLRAVGCRTGAAGEEGERVSTFTEATLGRDNVELMCRMEHARWCAEKRLAGWLYGEVDDPKRRRTRDLVEWEKLPDSARDKDLRVVEGIPRFLEAVGLHVFRVESGTDGETRSSSQPRGPHEPD